MSPRQQWKRRLLVALASGALLGILSASMFVAGDHLYARSNTRWSLFGAPVLAIPAFLLTLGAAAGLLLSPVLLIPKSTRSVALPLASGSIVYLVLWISIVRFAPVPPQMQYEQVARRAAPLVEAIHAYERANGEPPSSLQALVPQYISTIPGTGLPAYPDFSYQRGNPSSWHGNPWVVYFHCGPLMGFDMFLYYPLQNYPEEGHGGYLEPIADWAYVHE